MISRVNSYRDEYYYIRPEVYPVMGNNVTHIHTYTHDLAYGGVNQMCTPTYTRFVNHVIF